MSFEHYRTLGRSGLRVSPLCLGTMMFGGATAEEDAHRIVAEAFEHGINFIDTADVYNGGESERIVGRAIAAQRDSWLLATKVGHKTGDGPNDGGLAPARVIRSLHASLARLGTDHVDVYYLHRPDPDTPLEETLRTVGELTRQGKIRHWGLSNFRGWQVADAVHLARRLGIAPPVVSQPYYNAANRMPEVEHLPACAHHGLGVVPYSPLARGVLTGKYQPGATPDPDSRIGRNDARALQTEWRPESLALARTVADEAGARGIGSAAFATAWVLNNRLVTSVIAGPRTLEQWHGYRAALDYRFTDEDEALFDRLVAPGHPSTPEYTDPQYPVTGRVRPAGSDPRPCSLG